MRCYTHYLLGFNTFIAGLGALYGYLILYVLLGSVHRTVINAFNDVLNFKSSPSSAGVRIATIIRNIYKKGIMARQKEGK